MSTPLILLCGEQAGNPLAADDDSGGNFDAAISDFSLPADGSYIAVLSHAGGGSAGAVRVLLEIHTP